MAAKTRARQRQKLGSPGERDRQDDIAHRQRADRKWIDRRRVVVALLLAMLGWRCLGLPAVPNGPATAEEVQRAGGGRECRGRARQERPVIPRICSRSSAKAACSWRPLVICSFVMLVFVFERAIALRRGRVIPAPFVKRFLLQLREGKLDRDQALELCKESQSPVADVFAGAVRKWGRSSVEIEQAMIDSGERVAHGLRRYMRLFNAVATISPLLGLVGTVFGMIHLFNDIAHSDAMGRTELLAGGISRSLVDDGRRAVGRHSGPVHLSVLRQPGRSAAGRYRRAWGKRSWRRFRPKDCRTPRPPASKSRSAAGLIER